MRRVLFGPVPPIMIRGCGLESGRGLLVMAGAEKCLPTKDVSSLGPERLRQFQIVLQLLEALCC